MATATNERRRRAPRMTEVKTADEPNLSARAQLTQWVRTTIVEERALSIPDVKNRARAHFAADAAFMHQLLNELLDSSLYEIVQRVVGSSRGLTVIGDEVVTKAQFEEHVREKRNKWASWLEHVNNRHIRLFDMNREELLVAAAEREQRANTELEIAVLWRRLADKLEGGERLGERFTAVEIEAERIRLVEERAKRSA